VERSIDDKTILDIIATSTYETFKKGKTVFKFGAKGDKFYLILHGEVGVHIPVREYKETKRQIR
jgi:CRP-like cAMP-binding protein